MEFSKRRARCSTLEASVMALKTTIHERFRLRARGLIYAFASVRERNHLLWHARGSTNRKREQASAERVGRVERERKSGEVFISVQHALLDRDAWRTTTALSLPLPLCLSRACRLSWYVPTYGGAYISSLRARR